MPSFALHLLTLSEDSSQPSISDASEAPPAPEPAPAPAPAPATPVYCYISQAMRRYALRDEQARLLAIRAQFEARQERMRISEIAAPILAEQIALMQERIRITAMQLERSLTHATGARSG